MRTKQLFLILALLCTMVQGAWADGGWELVYRQTKTTSANWTALNAGSSTGYTIGTAGTTTYYYATGNLSFTNSTVGGSGLTIRGTVYLYIPSGKTVRCTGAKANDTGITGGGAGVELAAGNTLYLLGDGRLEATGGDGESGYRGDHGEDANFEYNKYCQPGSGGRGGDGGGGGGAGIGTRGGNGGAGGAGGSAKRDENEGTNKGVAGSPGSNGDTAGSMGTLYVYQGWNLSVVAKGGGAGWFTSARSNRGKNAAEDPYNQYAASAGGGGGTSGNGGAGSDIGTGGGGGGGGGGGAAGNSTWRNNASNGFYRVGAGGGKGGGNYDGSYAWDGGSSELSNPYDAELNKGLEGTYDDDGWEKDNGAAAGGSGGTCGAASQSGAAVTINVVLDDIFKGKGTESAPYIIGSIADWDVFALLVSNGISFNGEYVKLTADISVSEMAGAGSASSFQGTFDGDGHTLTVTLTDDGKQGLAPFRYISSATIKNLKVAGTIASNQYHTSGLVGFANGTNTIEDCVVTATLNISSNYAGGIIGHGLTSATTITGCAFAGTINGVGGNRSNIGGIWGWSNSATPTLVNCLEAGTYTNISSMHPMGLMSNKGTITNCYYVNSQIGSPLNACTVSGAAKAIALDTAPDNLGDLVQGYGIVKAYANGLLYNGKYYVPFALSGSGTVVDPYLITSTDDWNEFADYVNNGISLSGKFVKLTADIDISTMAGTSSNQFQGTFDGDGQTLTFTKGTSAEPFAEEYCAPFRHVKNATIKNLHVDGTIYTNQKKAAGFVGESHGALTLTGCRSSIAINSSISGDSKDGTHGGLVSTLSGSGNTITIEGCVFDGSFATTNGTNNCGGFIGWGVYNKPTIKNSLMKPGSVAAGMLNSTFARWYTGNEGIYEPTIDNCYYVAVDNLPANQGTEAAVLNITPANPDYDYGMVKAYKNGIWFDDNFYGTPATVTLADNADNSTTISNNNGYVANVTLAARTLYKDGAWNTICLPFDVTIAGSPLAGATARPLTSASITNEGTTLSLSFGDAVTTLKAGTPYIIKWASGDNIDSPVFNGVTIDATERNYDNDAEGDDRVRFMGTYSCTTFTAADNSILLLGGENKLYYPATGAGIGAQRAYFKIGDGAQLARSFTSFSIDFGEGDNATGIINVSAETRNNADGWYSLDGRKVEGKPSKPGVYIQNGRKVVIK